MATEKDLNKLVCCDCVQLSEHAYQLGCKHIMCGECLDFQRALQQAQAVAGGMPREDVGTKVPFEKVYCGQCGMDVSVVEGKDITEKMDKHLVKLLKKFSDGGKTLDDVHIADGGLAPLCKKHEKEDQWYCMECQRMVCADCDHETKHPKHHLLNNADAVVAKIAEGIPHVENVQDTLRRWKDEDMEDMETEIELVLGDISVQYDQMIRFLHKQKEHKLEEAKQLLAKKKANMKHRKEIAETIMRHGKTVVGGWNRAQRLGLPTSVARNANAIGRLEKVLDELGTKLFEDPYSIKVDLIDFHKIEACTIRTVKGEMVLDCSENSSECAYSLSSISSSSSSSEDENEKPAASQPPPPVFPVKAFRAPTPPILGDAPVIDISDPVDMTPCEPLPDIEGLTDPVTTSYVVTNDDFYLNKSRRAEELCRVECNKLCGGGAVFDERTRILYETSNYMRGGKSIFITNLSAKTPTTTSLKVIPFKTWCVPIYDGVRYIYFVENFGPGFGRFDTRTHTFDKLPQPEVPFGNVSGFFSNGCIFAFDSLGQGHIHNIQNRTWYPSPIAPEKNDNRCRFLAHPWFNDRAVYISLEGYIWEVCLHTGTVLKKFPGNYNRQNSTSPYEAIVMPAPKGHYYVLMRTGSTGQPWCVYSTKYQSWRVTPWHEVNTSSATAFFDPATETLYFHGHLEGLWTCVSLK